MDGDRFGEVTSEDPDDKLYIGHACFNPAAEAIGEFDLTLVAAVFPLVE
jgi:hypothetical protein